MTCAHYLWHLLIYLLYLIGVNMVFFTSNCHTCTEKIVTLQKNKTSILILKDLYTKYGYNPHT